MWDGLWSLIFVQIIVIWVTRSFFIQTISLVLWYYFSVFRLTWGEIGLAVFKPWCEVTLWVGYQWHCYLFYLNVILIIYFITRFGLRCRMISCPTLFFVTLPNASFVLQKDHAKLMKRKLFQVESHTYIVALR